MSKHTPGPWKIEMHPMGTFVRCSDGYIISGPVNERPGHEANARLIAAALDLLEALKMAAQQLETDAIFMSLSGASGNHQAEAALVARAAIAKATGEQS